MSLWCWFQISSWQGPIEWVYILFVHLTPHQNQATFPPAQVMLSFKMSMLYPGLKGQKGKFHRGFFDSLPSMNWYMNWIWKFIVCHFADALFIHYKHYNYSTVNLRLTTLTSTWETSLHSFSNPLGMLRERPCGGRTWNWLWSSVPPSKQSGDGKCSREW